MHAVNFEARFRVSSPDHAESSIPFRGGSSPFPRIRSPDVAPLTVDPCGFEESSILEGNYLSSSIESYAVSLDFWGWRWDGLKIFDRFYLELYRQIEYIKYYIFFGVLIIYNIFQCRDRLVFFVWNIFKNSDPIIPKYFPNIPNIV